MVTNVKNINTDKVDKLSLIFERIINMKNYRNIYTELKKVTQI